MCGTRSRFAGCARPGEPLNPEAIRWFREQYGVTVLDYYGLTESYPLVANYPFLEVREGSMGKPMPGWDVQILDEDERPVGLGERGEICLRARSNPHYPLGYWRNDEAGEETFGGEWFHTKDAAVQDEDGYFWYVGRADDVIIAAGYRIGPFEVESACLEHPAVREAAAVASPDELRGNVVKAFIVLADGYAPTTSSPKRSRASSASGSRRTPTRVSSSSSPDLPKTLTGKIRRVELRQLRARSRRRRPGHVIAAEQRSDAARLDKRRAVIEVSRRVRPRANRGRRRAWRFRAGEAAGLRAPRCGKTRPTRKGGQHERKDG